MSLAVSPEPVPISTDKDGVVRVGTTRVTLDTVVSACLSCPSSSTPFTEPDRLTLIGPRKRVKPKPTTATLKAMTETFQQQDKLLAGQAQLPIYYEFAKRHAGQYADTIRHFLTTFEDERKAARAEVNAKGMENIGALSSTLVEYNGLLRSPDDRTKQERMFNILNERFKRFLQDVRRDAETK